MGNRAEHIARENYVSREDQGQFSLESQQKAVSDIESVAFNEETVAVEVLSRRGTKTVDVDQGRRPDTKLEVLANLKPAFEKRVTVTAGLDPQEVFIAPVMTIRKVLDKAGMSIDDIDLFELNEVFSA